MTGVAVPDHPSYTGLVQVIGAEAVGHLSLALAGKQLYVPCALAARDPAGGPAQPPSMAGIAVGKG